MRLLSIILFVFLAHVGNSQKIYMWFDTGLKAMYGGSSVINQAAIDHKDLDYSLTFGNAYSVGGKFGINRGYNGLALELMYTQAKHDFVYKGTERYKPRMDWTSIDMYVLFRNAQNLSFFEIGPKIALYQELNRANSVGQMERMDDVPKYGLSGVLSMGVNVLGQDDGPFSGQIGLRLEYGFSDMIAKAGQDAGEPIPYIKDLYADGYKKSIPVYAGLVFELNWGLGYYGKSSCSNKAKLMSF